MTPMGILKDKQYIFVEKSNKEYPGKIDGIFLFNQRIIGSRNSPCWSSQEEFSYVSPFSLLEEFSR